MGRGAAPRCRHQGCRRRRRRETQSGGAPRCPTLYTTVNGTSKPGARSSSLGDRRAARRRRMHERSTREGGGCRRAAHGHVPPANRAAALPVASQNSVSRRQHRCRRSRSERGGATATRRARCTRGSRGDSTTTRDLQAQPSAGNPTRQMRYMWLRYRAWSSRKTYVTERANTIAATRYHTPAMINALASARTAKCTNMPRPDQGRTQSSP